MNIRLYFLLAWIGLGLHSFGEVDLVQYVNTLQGTDSKGSYSNGNTYPTVAVPYPMHAYSAQTGKNGYGWKYQYEAKTIRGFQQVHQCSPWVNDYNVFSLFPEVGTLEVDQDKRASVFRHKNEIAKPHYYSVTFDNGIRTEISPTERCGHMRFSYPKGQEAWLVLDGCTGDSRIEINPDLRRITGWVHNGGWLTPGKLKSYFILEFDQPFAAYGTWDNQNGIIHEGNREAEGTGFGAVVHFKPGSIVQVKVCTSYISQEQADITFKSEIASARRLEDTKAKAAKLWNDLLGRVKVEGKSEADKATFYSCLFRANLFSHRFYEIKENGQPYYFSPFDEKVHDGHMYTDNGFWDTFRSQFPLTNILHPTMQGRYMQALLDAQEQCGWYPSWCCPGNSGIMIGNHAISLLTDAMGQGHPDL